MSLVLASYNIHRCYGRDGRYDPGRVRDVLRELDAQVIALQEVELMHDNPHLLKDFCEDSRWKAIPGLTLSRERGHYGNALLTELPVINIERIDLSLPSREPRGALSVMLEYHRRPIHIIATHLGLRPGERRWQVRRLLELLQKHEADPVPAAVTVLMGDLNEWFLWGRPLRWLHRHFQNLPAPATFPAHMPFLSLDRIWVKPRRYFRSVRAWKSHLAQRASDHLPLLSHINIDPE